MNSSAEKSEEWRWVLDRVQSAVDELKKATWQFEIQRTESIQYTSYSFLHYYGGHFDNSSKQTKDRCS